MHWDGVIIPRGSTQFFCFYKQNTFFWYLSGLVLINKNLLDKFAFGGRNNHLKIP